jgi:hypothetical protein
MAIHANINAIFVLDAAYFIKGGIMTDDGMAQEIIMAVEEATQYESCLVVFDLDSIADITKEYSSLQSDIKTASQVAYSGDKNDPQFSYASNRNLAFRAALECLSMIPDKEKNQWFIAISNHNKLTLDFKEKTNWPATDQQRRIEQQIFMNNVPQICKFCTETFRAKDNNPNDCGRHSSNFLYDEDYVNRLKSLNNKPNYDPFTDDAVDKRLLYIPKLNVLAEIAKIEPKENQISLESARLKNISKYKWVCCRKTFWEKGELKDKHQAKDKTDIF